MAQMRQEVLRGRLPWWPLWGVGALALFGTVAADLAIPSTPLHLAGDSGALAIACGAAAVALGTVATRGRHPRGPSTTLGRRASFPWTAVRIGQEERLRHVHCLGPSGSGKARSILGPMLVQDLNSGAGVTVVEVKGSELCSTARASAERLGRPVIEWEPGNPESACWNPLSDPSPATADRLVHALQRTAGGVPAADYYATVGGKILRHVVAAFANAGEALDLGRLRDFLMDATFRQTLMVRVGDPDILSYFRTVFDAWKPDERLRNLQGVLTHLDALLAQPFVRRSVCPPPGATEIDLQRCMREGAVLLVRLPMGDMLRLAEALGAFLLSALQAAVYAREAGGPPHYLYLDEFWRFCGPDFGQFLALAGEHRVGAVLAHQNLAQLRQAGGAALQETVLCSAGTTVLLRCDGSDAEALASWLPARGPRRWEPRDLSELPFGVGVARLSGGRRPRTHHVRLGYVGSPGR